MDRNTNQNYIRRQIKTTQNVSKKTWNKTSAKSEQNLRNEDWLSLYDVLVLESNYFHNQLRRSKLYSKRKSNAKLFLATKLVFWIPTQNNRSKARIRLGLYRCQYEAFGFEVRPLSASVGPMSSPECSVQCAVGPTLMLVTIHTLYCA